MSKDTPKTEATEATAAEQYATALEAQKDLKVSVSDAKAELRKFKKANKVRKVENIKDEKILEKFKALEAIVEEAQKAWEESKDAATELKPQKQRGGGGSYAYGQIKDADSGDMRDATDQEKKKWRTHARKVAKKEEIEAKDVAFDPTFFEPKVSKKDAKKAAKEAGKSEAKPDAKPDAKEETPAAEKSSRKGRRRK